MKIQPRTKLDPADLHPYAPGRAGSSTSTSSSPGTFRLTPQDLSPAKPGLSSKAVAGVDPGPLDVSPFRPGHPVRSGEMKPLDFGERPSLVAAGAAGKSQHDQLTEKTQKWVSQTFFGALLKQMGESPFKSELFSGGRGGETFSSLYHQQLADRMARGAGTKLVHSLVKSIESRQAKAGGSALGVQGSEKKGDGRPLNAQDPRTKAYMRPRSQPGKQSTFSLAA